MQDLAPLENPEIALERQTFSQTQPHPGKTAGTGRIDGSGDLDLEFRPDRAIFDAEVLRFHRAN